MRRGVSSCGGVVARQRESIRSLSLSLSLLPSHSRFAREQIHSDRSATRLRKSFEIYPIIDCSSATQRVLDSRKVSWQMCLCILGRCATFSAWKQNTRKHCAPFLAERILKCCQGNVLSVWLDLFIFLLLLCCR